MLAGAPMAVRESQVRRELSGILENINILESSITDLESRLKPVLRDHESTLANKDEEKASLVFLAEEIRNYNFRITSLYKMIQSIVERLEL